MNALITCSNCKNDFEDSEVIDLKGYFVCGDCKPVFLQKLEEGIAYLESKWCNDENKYLVTSHNTLLPKRCFKCNSDEIFIGLDLKRYWMNPLFGCSTIFLVLIAIFSISFMGIFIIPIIIFFIILNLLLRKKYKIKVHLCERHNRFKTILTNTSLLFLFFGVISIILLNFFKGYYFGPSIAICFFVSLVFYGLAQNFLTIKKATTSRVWYTGASKAFLLDLPKWKEN